MAGLFLGSTTPTEQAAVVACPHNRIRQSVTKIQTPLENVGWAHVCRCCENVYMEPVKHGDLCRRCRGPAVHGWKV
jgi:hypothetical protein